MIRPLAFSVASLLALLAFGAPAAAEPAALDLSAGTLGVAASISRSVGSGTRLRFTYGTVAFGRTEQFDNLVIDVTARLKLTESFRVRTAGLYAERTLRGGPFAAVVGVVDNLNHISAVSVPADQSITIAGVVYPQANAGVIMTEIGWARIAPYLGIAFAPRSPRRLAFVGEIGGIIQGHANVDFSATGAILANQAKFQPYYDDERRQLTAELAPVQIYPVIQAGLRLRL